MFSLELAMIPILSLATLFSGKQIATASPTSSSTRTSIASSENGNSTVTTKVLPTINLQLICEYDIRPIDLEQVFEAAYMNLLKLPPATSNVSVRMFDKLDGMEAISYPSMYCNMTSNHTMLTAKVEAVLSAKTATPRIDVSDMTRDGLKRFFDRNVCNQPLSFASRVIFSQSHYADRNAYRHDYNFLCSAGSYEEEQPQTPLVFGLLVGLIMFGMFMNEFSLMGSVQQRQRRRERLRQYDAVQIELPSFEPGAPTRDSRQEENGYGGEEDNSSSTTEGSMHSH